MDIELKLLNIITENDKINQRAIAKEVGVSLGTINSMLRNLEAQNYLIINKTSHNSAIYILTEAGKFYRSQKLYNYIVECSDLISQVRMNLKSILSSYIAQGISNFYLSEKEDEFYRIVLMILMELARKNQIKYDTQIPSEISNDSIILGWKEDNNYSKNKKYVHLVSKI